MVDSKRAGMAIFKKITYLFSPALYKPGRL